MANNPPVTKSGVRGKNVANTKAVYFDALRMEHAGRLRPGTALLLAATLPNTQAKTTRKGKGK